MKMRMIIILRSFCFVCLKLVVTYHLRTQTNPHQHSYVGKEAKKWRVLLMVMMYVIMKIEMILIGKRLQLWKGQVCTVCWVLL